MTSQTSFSVHTTPHLASITILAWRQKLSPQCPQPLRRTRHMITSSDIFYTELRLGNTIWTKPMWAVVFYDWNIFVGWDNTENIFIGGCEVYEGMIGNRPAEDQVLLGLSRNVGG